MKAKEQTKPEKGESLYPKGRKKNRKRKESKI